MTAQLPFPLQYVRQQAAPIDVDAVFSTTAARNAYLTSPRRYAGQIVSDSEDGGVYCLSADGSTWLPLGSAGPAGGELSGTYPDPTLLNSAVIGKVLTGLSISGGAVVATDSIVSAFGKVQNQINGLVGGMEYQGVWNASTNTPTLTSSVGTKGFVYKVSVAGTTNLNGIAQWNVGDFAVFNGTTWDKWDGLALEVSSVFGRTGAVTAQSGDYSFSQIGSTPTNLAGYGIVDGVSLTGTQTLTNKSMDGTLNTFTNISQGSISSLPYLGVLYNKSSFPNLSDFTTNGATASASSNQIVLSGGTSNVDLTHSLDLSAYGYTLLDEFVVETTFIVGTISSTSYGVGIGMRSANTANSLSIMGRIDLTNTGSAGKVEIVSANIGTATLSAGAIAFSAGDTIYMRFERKYGVFSLTAYNTTTGTSNVEITYSSTSCTSTSGTGLLPDQFCNTGRFAIFSLGGTQNITSLKVSSNTNVNADYAVIGDSKSIGIGANSWTTSFGGLLSNYAKVINLSGVSDRTVEMLLRMSEIVALKPKTVLLTMGRNDLGSDGTVTSTLMTNYASIISTLQGAGIKVLVVAPFYETTINETAWYNYLVTNYSSMLIDTWTPTLKLGTQGLYDAVHPNQIGHDLIASTIKNSGLFEGKYGNIDFTYSSKSGQRQMIPVYDLNNRYTYSSLFTYDVVNNILSVGNFKVFAGTFNSMSLNGQSGNGVNFIGSNTATILYINRPTGGDICFRENNTTQDFVIKSGGKVSVGTTDPTALFHISNASAGTAGTAPLKLTSGTLLTTIEVGTTEYNGALYASNGASNRLGIGGVIADFISDVGNSGTAETDLYTYTTKANTLNTSGEKLKARFSGNIVGRATASRVINVYFAGTQVYTTGSLTISTTGSFDVSVGVVRTGSATARVVVNLTVDNVSLTAPVSETDLTGLTFTGTNIIKITGTSSGTGSASNDIVAKMGDILWYPAASN